MAYGFAHGARADSFFGYLKDKLDPTTFEALWKTYPIRRPFYFKTWYLRLSDER